MHPGREVGHFVTLELLMVAETADDVSGHRHCLLRQVEREALRFEHGDLQTGLSQLAVNEKLLLQRLAQWMRGLLLDAARHGPSWQILTPLDGVAQ